MALEGARMFNFMILKRANRVHLLVAVIVILLAGALLYLYISSKPGARQAAQVTNSNKKVATDAYAGIPSNQIDHIQSDGEFTWNLNDPYYFFNTYPIAALVHIDSIDGGRSYSPISDQNVYPQTYGTMKVLKVYKGNVKPGQKLNYSRIGAIVSFQDYYNGLNQQQKDKYNYLSKGEKPAKQYVEVTFQDDIAIEVNKNYIVFLTPQTSKDGSLQEYAMEGMQYGLREVRGHVSGPSTGIQVKNNQTGEWENPGKILKLN